MPPLITPKIRLGPFSKTCLNLRGYMEVLPTAGKQCVQILSKRSKYVFQMGWKCNVSLNNICTYRNVHRYLKAMRRRKKVYIHTYIHRYIHIIMKLVRPCNTHWTHPIVSYDRFLRTEPDALTVCCWLFAPRRCSVSMSTPKLPAVEMLTKWLKLSNSYWPLLTTPAGVRFG
jgi:hypothetical protein